MQPTHWGLTIAEWLTIAAIVLGPIVAVLTQLWMQARKAKRDSKLWAFNQLMAHRATPVNANFVRAFNMIDAVFYKNAEVRQKRKEFLDYASRAQGRDLTPQESDKMKDLVAEMLAKMGRDLGFTFDHTEIKDTGYYPQGFVQIETEQAAVRAKVLKLLDGHSTMGVTIKEEPPKAPMIPPGAVRRN